LPNPLAVAPIGDTAIFVAGGPAAVALDGSAVFGDCTGCRAVIAASQLRRVLAWHPEHTVMCGATLPSFSPAFTTTSIQDGGTSAQGTVPTGVAVPVPAALWGRAWFARLAVHRQGDSPQVSFGLI